VALPHGARLYWQRICIKIVYRFVEVRKGQAMAWWAWAIGGAVFLGAELFLVDAQFYLVFVGCAALVTACAAFFVDSLGVGSQWGLFALLAVLSMIAFRRRVYAWVRGRPQEVRAGPMGDHFTLLDGLEPGNECRLEHGGTTWTVRNGTNIPLQAGAKVRVDRVVGMTLNVTPE
jgi:membrane protein implicated in regulation of membrane protease activity